MSSSTLSKFMKMCDSVSKPLYNHLLSLYENFDKNGESFEESKEYSYVKELSSIFTDYEDFLIENPSKKVKLVDGNVQSGKSDVMAGIAIYNVLVAKKTTILVVRDLKADMEQFASKFYDGKFSHLNLIPVDVKKGRKAEAVLKKALSSEIPSLVITLANHTRMKILNDIIYDLGPGGARFDLVVDEADAIAYKKVGDSGKFNHHMKKMLPYANQSFMVTATCFSILFQEYNMFSENIYLLSPPQDYKGIDAITMNPIGFPKSRWFVKDGRYNRLSPELLEYYYSLSTTDGFTVYNIGEQAFSHPIINLQKGSNSRTSMHLDTIYEFATNDRLEEWACIAYNGKGIYLYLHPEFIPEDFDVEGIKPKIATEGRLDGLNILYFKDVTIQQVIQRLKEMEILTHINIVSSLLAGRGLNFTSSDYKWHLTHQILSLSDTATAADLIQSIRLMGRYRDDIPLTLTAEQRELNNLRFSHKVQEKLVSGAMEFTDIPLPDTISKIELPSHYIPKRKLCKKSKYSLNIVAEEEKKIEEDERKRRDECISQAKKDTGIGQIIRHFLCCEPMKFKEFNERCYELFGIQYNNSLFTIGKYCRHGVLLVKNQEHVDIHPDYRKYV